MFAKETRIHDLALQGSFSSPPILMAGGFSSSARLFRTANKII
jgi:hypothetical protein